MTKAEAFYNHKLNLLQAQLKILYNRRTAIAWLRFAVFILTCLAIYFLWSVSITAIVIAVVCGIAVFLFIVSKDIDNKNIIKNLETILLINKNEINYLKQDFADKYDGKDLAPSHHVYAKDLDIFGSTSLFQYINRCNAEQAIKLFAEQLLQPLTKEKILEQQSAIKELSTKTDWWQQFQAFGMNEKITTAAENKINKWLKQDEKIFINAGWKLLLYIYPVITLTCLYLFLDNVLSTPVFFFIDINIFLYRLNN